MHRYGLAHPRFAIVIGRLVTFQFDKKKPGDPAPTSWEAQGMMNRGRERDKGFCRNKRQDKRPFSAASVQDRQVVDDAQGSLCRRCKSSPAGIICRIRNAVELPHCRSLSSLYYQLTMLYCSCTAIFAWFYGECVTSMQRFPEAAGFCHFDSTRH